MCGKGAAKPQEHQGLRYSQAQPAKGAISAHPRFLPMSHLIPNLLQQSEAAHTPHVLPFLPTAPCKAQTTLRAGQWDRHRDTAEKETMTKFTPQFFPLTPQQPTANLVLFPSCLICFRQPQAKCFSAREREAFGIHEKTHTLILGHAGCEPRRC